MKITFIGGDVAKSQILFGSPTPCERCSTMEASPQSVSIMPPKPPTIHVLRPGLFTTMQDLGRNGYQRFGVSVSGAMDPWALTAGVNSSGARKVGIAG